MSSRFLSLLFLGALTVVPMGASAATLTTYTQYNTPVICDTNSASSGQVTSSCGSFTSGDGIDSRASYGDLGLRSRVEGPSAFGSGPSPEDYDYWRGGAAFHDTLNFSVATGTFRLFTDIAVSLIEDVTGSFGGSSIPFGRNLFSISVGSTTIFQRYHEYSNVGGLAALTFTDDFGSTGTGFVDLAFTGGSLDLSVSMYSDVRCGAQHVGNISNKTGTCLLGVDAFNSIRLIGSSVLDFGGSEVPGGFVGSDSGFDYSEGVDPHSPAPVPLPAGVVLLLSGLVGLGFVRRLKRT